jgi:ribosomal protein L20A (L18A)
MDTKVWRAVGKYRKRNIEISEVIEIKPEEVVSLELRTILGVESEIG